MMTEWHGGQNNGPHPSPRSHPGICRSVTFHGNMADVIQLRILRRELILDYPDGPSIITRVLIGGGRRVRVRVREGDVTIEGGLRGIPEDATQLSLKTVDWATSQ